MNAELRKSITKTYTIAIALILGALAVSGCGTAPQSTVAPVAATPPANTQAPPPAPAGSLPNSDLFGIPSQSANALLGVYTGTLYKRSRDGTVSEQPFAATVHTVSLSPQQPPYAALSFRSNGSIGNIAFDSYLNIGLAGYPANGVAAFGFSSSAQRIPELLEDQSFTVHLILSLKNGVFSSDPTHSAIFIKECGFSQGAACSNFAQDVWFGGDLRKQSP